MTIINRLLGVFFPLIAFSAFADKEWAFLVFLNGHNNLSEYGDININQLETVGSTDTVDFIVQWAKQGAEQTHRLKVARDQDENNVTSPFVESLPRIDMGDYRNLVDFVKWSATHYPAKHYFVVIWNHGSGWHRHRRAVRGISYDDYSGNHITTEQLGLAMNEVTSFLGRKIDIVGADACLMAMAEVGAEIASSVRYLLASEELEPGLGWPYHRLAAWWIAHPEASAEEIGRALVTDYVASFAGESGITLSMANLDEMGSFLGGLRRFAERLMSLNDTEFATSTANFGQALTFSTRDYADIGSFLSVATVGMEEEMNQLRQSYNAMIVTNLTSPELAAATGMSFWIPNNPGTLQTYLADYQRLQMSKLTGWETILQRLQDQKMIGHTINNERAGGHLPETPND